jgi:hypothetical protein
MTLKKKAAFLTSNTSTGIMCTARVGTGGERAQLMNFKACCTSDHARTSRRQTAEEELQ